jgi:PAS domain S-box-containing protein
MNLSAKRAETNQKISYLISQNTKLLDSLVKSIVDLASKPILIVSDNSIFYANREAIKLLGIPLKALKEKKIEEIFVISKGAQLVNIFAKSANLKNSQLIGELKLKISNSKEHWVSPRIKRCLWKGKSALMIDLQQLNNEKSSTSHTRISYENILQALKTAKQGIWNYNLNSSETHINQEFFSMLGYIPGEGNTNPLSWEEILHHDSLSDFKKMIEGYKQGKEIDSTWEYSVKDKNNDYRWILAINQVTDWDKNGKPTRLTGLHKDINEQKKCEIEKEEYQKLLYNFFQHSHDGIIIIDEKGVIKEWNKTQEQITNIKEDQVVGKTIWDVQQDLSLKKETSVNYINLLKKVFSIITHTGVNPWEGKVYETAITLDSGEQKHIQQTFSLIRRTSSILFASIIKDITESRASHLKVEKSEERLKLAISAGNVGIWDYDFTNQEIYISPTAYTIFGYLPKEIEPSENLYKSVIHPDDLDEAIQKLRTLFISGNVLEMELRVRRKNGEYMWILSKNRIIRDEHGEKLRATGTISDITRQKNVEIELRQSQKDLTKNLKQHEILSEISYVLNTNIDFQWKNSEVLRLIGIFTNTSRVYIFENIPEKNITVNTYEWCNKNITPQIDNLQDVALNVVKQSFKGKDYLYSSNIKEDLSPEFASTLLSQGIESLLVFPLQVSGKHFGYIGFDECTYERKWEKSEIELLKTISNLISFSYERELSQMHFQQNEERYRELTEKLPQIIFEVSHDGRIDFLNLTGCKFFGVTKNHVNQGLFVWNIFPLREVVKMKKLRNNVIVAPDLEPIRLEVKTAEKHIKPMVFFIRPRMEGGELINFTGIALQPES